MGAAEIGLSVGFFAAAALIPGAAFLVGSVAVDAMIAGIGLMGVGEEGGAIADAIAGNRGENISVRQPASPRQVIYGTQRVGGVIVFVSSTGSSKDQFNFIITVADHEVTAIQNLYLDGRQVYWAGSGPDYQVRNGYGFGGGADGNSHLGPTGNDYTFDNASSGHSGVYAAVRYGDQTQGDYVASLTANDPRWGPDGSGNCPSMVGCAYIYLKVEYDPNLFPQQPEVKLTVKGKPVYDPRTGLSAYSENPALIIADFIGNTEYGLGDASVNQDQLVAAANICDELVAYAGGGGGNEARYSCNYHFDTATNPADVIETLLSTCGGRLSRIGGEWYIFPATYTGATVSLSSDNLLDKPTWSSTRSYRDLSNVVNGVYTAPNYPYSSATAPGSLSDLYDTNGYYNGSTANDFPFAFQPTSYPSYQQDTTHGYPANEYLIADGGVTLPMSLNLPAVLSVSQAQRLAKIALERNRQQGSGQFTFMAAGFNLQPNDTFNMTFPQRGWTDKLLEVNSVQTVLDDSGDIPFFKVIVGVNETDSSVYDWSITEELTVYAVPAATGTDVYTTAPPTDMALLSSAATALLQPDGTVIPRIQVTWNTPADVRVTGIDVQYQLTTDTSWTDSGITSVNSNLAFIAPTIAGQAYNVRIGSVRSNGATSVWVVINNFTSGLVLNSQTQQGVGIGSLFASVDGSNADITCDPFTATIGQNAVAMFPAGAVTLTLDGTVGVTSGTLIAQKKLYYVYYIDPTSAGGNVTPIATTNLADFLGKLGYWLIDSVVTPASGTLYYPTYGNDIGNVTTQNIPNAYDGNLATYANLRENGHDEGSAECIFGGFPPISFASAAKTLTIIATFGGGDGFMTATVGGTTTPQLAPTVATAMATYTVPVPAGTNLSMVSVDAAACAGGLQIFEIYIS